MKRDKIEMSAELFMTLLEKVAAATQLPLTEGSILQQIVFDHSRNIVSVYVVNPNGHTPEGQESHVTWADGISE